MKLTITTIILTLYSTLCAASQVDSLSSHNIDSIVVKSYRFDIKLKDAPNKVELISRKDINRVASINIADIVKKSTSAESADLQGLASGVEFRGFTPSSMGVNKYSVMLIDGVPMGTRNAAATSLYNIDGIEIFKGPFSSIYGSGAMGGFINIITAQTKGKISGGFAASYGSYNTSNIGANIGGNIVKRLDFDLSLCYFDRNNNYKTGRNSLLHTTNYENMVLDNNARGAIYNNTTLDKTNATLRIGYDFSHKWRLNLYNDLYYTANAPSNNMLWGLDGQTTSRDVVRNYHRADLTTTQGNHSLRFSPYISREKSHDNYASKYGDSSNDNIYKTYGFQLQDAIKIAPWIQIALGMDNFTQDYVSRQYSADGAGIAPWQPNYLSAQTALFAQTNLTFFNSKLSSIVGLRYDNTHLKTYATPHLDNVAASKNYNTLNPNIALKYRPLEPLDIHASLGTAFIAPDAFMTTGEYRTYTLIKGNPELRPEKSFSYDFGIGYSSKNRALQADITLFSTEYKNKIISTFIDNYTTYTNSDHASMRGYEAMASFDIGRELSGQFSLNIYANYTRIFRSELKSNNKFSPIRYLAQNNATYGIDLSLNGFSARISGRYIGSKINDNYVYDYDSSFRKVGFTTASGVIVRSLLVDDLLINMPDFMLFDAHLGYSFNSVFALNFKLENIFNELYAERDGYYMPGINFTLQVSVKF